jgi:tetratricopeptide (TPR) repeat protein
MDIAMAPTAVEVRDAAEYVERLGRLRVWAGRPSFRRLAALAGTTITSSGHVVDRLPPSTVSDTLNGKRLPGLPRMELVEAFVSACLSACHLSADTVDATVEQWLTEWRRLADVTDAGDRPHEPVDPAAQRPSTSAPPAGAVAGDRRLIGRHDALRVMEEALDGTSGGAAQFVAIVGEPGAGKTRLLGELAAGGGRRGLAIARGRAGEFEQQLPLGVFIDALNDHLDGCADLWRRDRLGAGSARLLGSVFPALSPASEDSGLIRPEVGGSVRHQLYWAVRRLLEEMAGPSGLMLILDDVHWADQASVELLEHLLRHPPRARVLIAVAYRPAQVAPRLTALIDSTAGRHQVVAGPLTLAETEEFLGAGVGRADCRALYEASGGNPFYLDALARMSETPPEADEEHPGGARELPASVQGALRVELDRLSPETSRVAEAAAAVADEFEPAIVAVAARLDEDAVLNALDELAACDLVRPTASGRRFQYRHPLVRSVVYQAAAPGRRLAAHARIARHLADLGATATVRAHHIERSACFGDAEAVATLAEAARTVASQAPVTAAHWMKVALQLLPDGPGDIDVRRELLVELAQVQLVIGRLAESREAAQEALRLLAPADLAQRSQAVLVLAMAERLLGRPEESQAMLLTWLRRLPDPETAASVPIRARLVGESLYRGDFRAAQSFLDSLPGSAESWDPTFRIAVAALRPMPAFAAGRVGDAIDHINVADRLFADAADDQVAKWIDLFTWMCWTELFIGRYQSALQRFDRVLGVARSSGQNHAVAMVLAGQARAYGMLGRLADARAVAGEAMEAAELVGSRQLLAIAMAQACLITAWAGDSATAVRFGERVVGLAGRIEEWWGAMAWHVWGFALINAGRLDQGADAVVHACDGFTRPRLDQFSLLSSCELMAYAETARGRPAEAARWANRADRIAHPGLEANDGLAGLARAHALRSKYPVAAAERARHAAGALATIGQHVDSGRAYLAAGAAHLDVDERGQAREELEQAAEIFKSCGAQGLRAQALRELRRIQHRQHRDR